MITAVFITCVIMCGMIGLDKAYRAGQRCARNESGEDGLLACAVLLEVAAVLLGASIVVINRTTVGP